MSSGAGAYQQSRIVSADPLDLVTMAYQRVIAEIGIARQCFEQNDIPGRGRAITKAWEILAELFRMLDRQGGGDIARNLASLYDFAMQRLLDAHTGKNAGALDEVERVLTPLAEAWEAVRVQEAAPAEQREWSPVAAFSAGSQYAPQHWTL